MKPLSFILLVFIAYHTSAQDIEQFKGMPDACQNIRDFTLSKDGTEAYFSMQSHNQELSQIAFIKKTNGIWSEPELAPFCDEYKYLEPFLSPNGLKLYFVSDRPLRAISKSKKDFDIWYVERNDIEGVWSAPVNMGANVNSEMDEFYPTLSENNNLYFTMESPSGLGKDDIYLCRWDGEKYLKPELLPGKINSAGYEFNAFISNDESFLIYTKYNADGGYGSGDLYVARRDEHGEWQEPENLGNKINTKYMEYCPFYDETDKILYFTSKRDSLHPGKFKTLREFQDYISKGENGTSKIYKYNIIFP